MTEWREKRHNQATPEGDNNGCADEIHFVRQQRTDWNPYKRKDLKYESNLRDESGISALIHKSKAWCLMCCCRTRTSDAEAETGRLATLSLDPADGRCRLTIISKQEATNLTTIPARWFGVFSWIPIAIQWLLLRLSQAQSTLNAPWWSQQGSATVATGESEHIRAGNKSLRD